MSNLGKDGENKRVKSVLDVLTTNKDGFNTVKNEKDKNGIYSHIDTVKRVDEIIARYKNQIGQGTKTDLTKIIETREPFLKKPERVKLNTDISPEIKTFEVVPEYKEPDNVFVESPTSTMIDERKFTRGTTATKNKKTTTKTISVKTKKVKQTPVNPNKKLLEIKEQSKKLKEEEKQLQKEEQTMKQEEKILEKEEKIKLKKAAQQKREEEKRLKIQRKLKAKAELAEQKEKKKQEKLKAKELILKKKEEEQKKLQMKKAAEAVLRNEKGLALKFKEKEKQKKLKAKTALAEQKEKERLKKLEEKKKQKAKSKAEKKTSKISKEEPKINIKHNINLKENSSEVLSMDEDVIKFLKIADDLLEKLPDDVIDEFAKSKDFEVYERVINKYKK
jgi:hypothetical protein